MSSQVFINFPVADLQKSKAFYQALGYTINEQFTNDDGACVVIDDGHIYVMLLTHDHFKKFTSKELVDAKSTTETLTALALQDKEAVDAMHEKAIAAGGKLHREEDLGFMYTKAIEDLDGHVWEFFFMDMDKMPQGE